MELLFPLLILFMIGLLFMSSRQRKKQQEQHDEMTRNLAVGDVVLTMSGVSGTIVDVDDEQTVDIEIAPDVITTWRRWSVREKLVEETADESDDTDESDDADDAADTTPSNGAVTAGTTEGSSVADTSSVPSRSS